MSSHSQFLGVTIITPRPPPSPPARPGCAAPAPRTCFASRRDLLAAISATSAPPSSLEPSTRTAPDLTRLRPIRTMSEAWMAAPTNARHGLHDQGLHPCSMNRSNAICDALTGSLHAVQKSGQRQACRLARIWKSP